MRKLKKHRIRVNCKCAAYLDIRTPLKKYRWLRCRCGRQLGDLQIVIVWAGLRPIQTPGNWRERLTRTGNQVRPSLVR